MDPHRKPCLYTLSTPNCPSNTESRQGARRTPVLCANKLTAGATGGHLRPSEAGRKPPPQVRGVCTSDASNQQPPVRFRSHLLPTPQRGTEAANVCAQSLHIKPHIYSRFVFIENVHKAK